MHAINKRLCNKTYFIMNVLSYLNEVRVPGVKFFIQQNVVIKVEREGNKEFQLLCWWITCIYAIIMCYTKGVILTKWRIVF